MRRLCPIDGRFCFLNFVRVSDAFQRLLLGLEMAHLPKRFHNQVCTHFGQLVVQAGRGVLCADGACFCQQHVTGVQARIHLHDGHARLGVACFNGTVNGRSAPPAGQQ